MSITYGYCGEPTVSWKIKYSTASVGSCIPGKMNVMLSRSITETTEAWYIRSLGSPYTEIIDWISYLLCDEDQIPSQISLSIQAVEQYNWRPKDASVVENSVINYNEPCSSRKKSRKITKMQLTASISGIGGMACSSFSDSFDDLFVAMKAISGLDFEDVEWFIESCSSEKPSTDWHKYSLSCKAETKEPEIYPEWTSISVNISGLNSPETSSISISSVQNFPDKSPYDTDFDSVMETLQTEAGVVNCPVENVGGFSTMEWIYEHIWPKI